jgi:hypothetical protein
MRCKDRFPLAGFEASLIGRVEASPEENGPQFVFNDITAQGVDPGHGKR